ncbi:hypothetical protein O9G_002216 [Rozella allomycis CSF55]|uniref:Uncharacterized protein n=1 Tax=Rozella allomycis (strain CSF55) TaxID=988480 RepID=A0A075AQ54_ROZAC|nr:hypothetical protein O9G_002216 [Rozella allomycis CSF55]|eukprot:EPZ32376.1 hypothetical protein O9G_002216 [Rozella allomycis CSF55]
MFLEFPMSIFDVALPLLGYKNRMLSAMESFELLSKASQGSSLNLLVYDCPEEIMKIISSHKSKKLSGSLNNLKKFISNSK